MQRRLNWWSKVVYWLDIQELSSCDIALFLKNETRSLQQKLSVLNFVWTGYAFHFVPNSLDLQVMLQWGANCSDGRASDWKTRRNTNTGSSPRCGKGFFFQSTSSVDSLTVSVQPPCAIACINIYVHVKNPNHWQPYDCLDTRTYYTHWQKWVVLLLRLLCLYQVRWSEFLARDK